MKRKWMPHIIAVGAFVVFVVLGLASASTPEPNASESAKMHFEQGKKFSEAHQSAKAIYEFDQAIELDPNFVEAYIYRASIYADGGREASRAAEADCNKAIELAPQNYRPYYLRGLIYRMWGKAELYPYGTKDKLTKALEYYDHALSDFNKALELNTSPNNTFNNSIAEAKTEKEYIETSLASAIAREATNKYDQSKFTVVPSDFKPADYTSVDLFKAASDAGNLQIASSREEAILNQMQSGFMLGGGSWFLQYVSDLTFVSQNGTNITFSSDDRAITQNMSIDQRSGLQAGQRVRVYYTIMRSPLTRWDVIAIERR